MELFGLLYEREPTFTSDQFARLSNICDNAGNVFLAVGVVAPIFTPVDNVNLLAILGGGFMTAVLWSTSVLLAKRGKNV